MKAADVRRFKERWKAVEEIERQELRALTLRRNWQQLNTIMRRAKRLGLRRGDDDGEMQVFERWTKVREHYGLKI